MQETWVWFLGWEDPLEKDMATHSSILAWRIPWTEEPGGLQSMGLQELGTTEKLSTHTHTHAHTHSGISFSHEKEENPASRGYMVGPQGHYAKWHKPGREGPILFDITYMLNLKKPNWNIYVTVCKTDSQWEFAVWRRHLNLRALWQPRQVGWGRR